MGLSNPTVTAGGGAPASQPSVKPMTPTTGQTVAYDNNTLDQTLYLAPAGALATLTVTLPSNASSRVGQIARMVTTQTITALTVNGATSILNNVTMLAGGESASFQKVADNTWALL